MHGANTVERGVEGIFDLVDAIHHRGRAHGERVLTDNLGVHSVRHEIEGAHLASHRVGILRDVLKATTGRVVETALLDVMGEEEATAASRTVVNLAALLVAQ